MKNKGTCNHEGKTMKMKQFKGNGLFHPYQSDESI